MKRRGFVWARFVFWGACCLLNGTSLVSILHRALDGWTVLYAVGFVGVFLAAAKAWTELEEG